MGFDWLIDVDVLRRSKGGLAEGEADAIVITNTQLIEEVHALEGFEVVDGGKSNYCGENPIVDHSRDIYANVVVRNKSYDFTFLKKIFE